MASSENTRLAANLVRGGARRSYFYLVLPVLLLAMALIGFWPQYYGRLLAGTALDRGPSHFLVHVHSSLFLGWLAILFTQAFFVRAGRVDLHRRFGPLFATYGYGAAGIGVVAGLQLAAWRVTRGGALDEAAVFVAAPLLDMLMFAAFLTAAIVYRRRPEVHKTLMLFAAYSFAFIGLVRFLARIPGALENIWLGTLLLVAPILACIAWEYATRRRIHAVWFVGLAAFTARLLLELLAALPPWLPVGRAMIRPFI
ncbi:MAG TPA: hypothetical protein VNA44_01875 [Burkholderiaceae bacterium]|nr:hypothetical protein [Burkholderiaceae bacterium]